MVWRDAGGAAVAVSEGMRCLSSSKPGSVGPGAWDQTRHAGRPTASMMNSPDRRAVAIPWTGALLRLDADLPLSGHDDTRPASGTVADVYGS
ncbi:hypothetical protein GCM10023336_05560 [Streptomyces similanensis]|uniref:Uncharacterized protein n=1 Tax=Streptomyces similanensis TaxID=1274988 RepID=A0ABP9JUR5_9ACTN